MIRYGYNRQVVPPAPFVHVTLSCAETKKELNDLPAQIDTAADRTVLPGKFVEDLGLVPPDEIPIGGFGGQVLLVRTYRVQLSLRQLQAITVEVIAHPGEPFILLGRDVLNRYRLLLDGPQMLLEITP